MPIKIRQSFKFKLCVWILGISTLVFTANYCANLYYVVEEIKEEVSATAWTKLDYVLRSLDEGFATTEVSADNLVGIAHSPLIANKRDSIHSLIEHFLKSNPRVQGVAVGFVPAVTSSPARGYCPYVMRMPDGSYRRRDVAEIRDYVNYDWYRYTSETRKTNWTKPFREANGTIITAYTVPLYNIKDEFFAVMAVDLNLDIINETLQDLKPYPNSILAITDADGNFIAHPNKDFILKESIQSAIEKNKEGANLNILKSIQKGERDVDFYEHKQLGRIAVFHAPEPKTGWTVILEVPVNDIAPGIVRMKHILSIIMLIGIILLIIVCLVVIRQLTKPLESFAEAARKISYGNFDVDIPVIKDQNELFDLRQALASMEVSLKEYINQLEETTKSKALIEGELNIARKIQMAMIPKIFPPYPERTELDIYGTLIPAKAVGGDLYDFILDGDDFYFCIGDVSGKGVPASLFMAITRSLFRNNVTHAKSPAKIATLLNNAIAQGNDENMFVTMFIGCCNLKTGLFTCCNCGHNAPVTNGEYVSYNPVTIGASKNIHFIEKVPVNLPIGVIENFNYEEVQLQLQPGVKILLYTDGITEAENQNAELFGDNRLISTLSSLEVNDSARKAIQTLLESVHNHTSGAEQSDDITVLCMCFQPENNQQN